MGDGGVYQRKVVLGVDASEHSERAFNCEYFHKIIVRLAAVSRFTAFVACPSGLCGAQVVSGLRIIEGSSLK